MATTTEDAVGELPTLIDRELFFGDPEISGAQLSPDGQWMSFLKPYEGARNIWVKAADAPFDALKRVAPHERPVPGYFWSRDSKNLLYVQDKNGDENFHVWAVDPAGERVGDANVPAARDLTPVDGVRATIYGLPRNRPDEILIGLNDRDARFHDVYRVSIATGPSMNPTRRSPRTRRWSTSTRISRPCCATSASWIRTTRGT